MDREEELEAKRQRVQDALRRSGGSDVTVETILSGEPLHYRNKVHAVFTHRREGEIISGIYEEGTHNVVKVDECLLENQTADAIIRDIRQLLKSFKIKTYNEVTGYGLFRHALIRCGHKTKQVRVVLVLGSPILPS